MNKIGIVTFWTSKDNYGQLLQCWALQQQLKKMKYYPFLIRYYWNPQSNTNLTFYKLLLKILLIYPLIKKIEEILKRIINRKNLDALNKKNELREFDKFREEHLICSDEVYDTLDQLQRNPPIADFYIAGSDSIWAQLVANKENQAFFLNFGSIETRKISYAASFLMDKYPEGQKKVLRSLLQSFYSVSVRESSGVSICKSVGCKSVQVLDPTLLLTKDDYLSKLEIKGNPLNMVYIYSVNIENEKEIRWSELKDICNKKGVDIKITMGSGMCPGYEIYGSDVDYEYSTIEKWIENINNAKFVVSASFHGVVFSIIMETPFAYIPFRGNKSRLNGRIYDLLSTLGLEDRILTQNVSYESLMSKTINWNDVRIKLGTKRQESIDFLVNSLV